MYFPCAGPEHFCPPTNIMSRSTLIKLAIEGEKGRLPTHALLFHLERNEIEIGVYVVIVGGWEGEDTRKERMSHGNNIGW